MYAIIPRCQRCRVEVSCGQDYCHDCKRINEVYAERDDLKEELAESKKLLKEIYDEALNAEDGGDYILWVIDILKERSTT